MKLKDLFLALLLGIFVFSPLSLRADDETNDDDSSQQVEDDEQDEDEEENDDDDRKPLFRKNTLRTKLLKRAIENRREEFDDLRERYKNASKEDRAILREDLKKGFIYRFDFVIERFTTITERLEEELDRLETDEGIDVTEAKEYLDSAKTDIEDIKTLVMELDEYIAEDHEPGDLEVRAKVKEYLDKIKAEIRSAHKNLKDAIKSAKSSSQNDNEEEDDDDDSNEE